MNPWKLTDREQNVLEAMANFGSAKLAAKEMGISHRTVEVYLHRVREKMGKAHTLLAVIAWDRYVLARTDNYEGAE